MSASSAPRTPRAVFAVALCALAPAALAAETGDEVRAEAALRGLARTGGAMELRVVLSSGSGGEFLLETRQARPVRARVQVPAGHAPRVVRLPVGVGVEPELRLAVRDPAGETRDLEVPLDLAARGERRVAVAAERGPGELGAHVQLVRVTPRDLPRITRGFDPVDGLLIDAHALRRLDAEQRSALAGHLRSCGRLLALDVSDRAWSELHDLAGCGGRLIDRAGPGADTAGALRALLETTPPVLPRAELLAAWLPAAGSGNRRAVVGWLAACGVALLLALWATRRPAWLLPLPLALGALLWLVFRLTPPSLASAVYLEATGAGEHARLSALLVVDGFAPGVLEVAVPEPLLPPVAPAGARQWSAGPDPQQDWRAAFDTRLLSHQALELRGVVPWRSGLGLGLVGKKPRVTNQGEQPSPAATLAWREGLYPVPSLDPGAAWSPDAAAGAGAAGDLLPDTLRALASRKQPALLRRLDGAELEGALADVGALVASGWLLLRPEAER